MTSYALRIATILITLHSLLLFPAPVSRAQDGLTDVEMKQAREAASLFVKLMEETGDFSRVIDEMYAGDFIERYLQEMTRDDEESSASSTSYFAPEINYKRDLLKQATIDDWRKLYIATNNFFYHVMVIDMNLTADDYLNDREPEDETFEKVIPPKVIELFKNHPILKGFIDIDKDDKPKSGEQAEEAQSAAAEKKIGPKPIETPEEMRNVTETIQEGLRLLLEEQGDRPPKLTGEAKKAIEMIRQKVAIEASIRISDNEYFGFPARVRFLEFPAYPMFMLTLAEVNGKQRIVWAEVFAGD